MGWYEDQLAREAAEKAEKEAKAKGTTAAPAPEPTQPGPFGTRLPASPPGSLGPRANPPAGSYYDQLLKDEAAAKAPTPPPDDGIIRLNRTDTNALAGVAMVGELPPSQRTLKPHWSQKWDEWLADKARTVGIAMEGGDWGKYEPRRI